MLEIANVISSTYTVVIFPLILRMEARFTAPGLGKDVRGYFSRFQYGQC